MLQQQKKLDITNLVDMLYSLDWTSKCCYFIFQSLSILEPGIGAGSGYCFSGD